MIEYFHRNYIEFLSEEGLSRQLLAFIVDRAGAGLKPKV